MTLEEILQKAQINALNDNTNSRFVLKKNRYTEGTFESVAEAIGKIYSDALTDDGQTDYEAICLAAIADPTGEIPGVEETDENKFLVKVHARVPKLHASLPKPDREFCESNRNLAIAMHPIFYSLQNNNTIPQPGNRVKVKFFTNGQGQYGEYLGILDPKQIAALKAQTSAREAMESPESPVVTNAEVSNPAGGGSNG